MDAKSLQETSLRFGYTTIPTADQILRDAVAIDTDGTDVDNLLEFGKVIEFVEANPRLFTDQKEQLVLSDAVPGKGVCLTLYSDHIEQIEKFRQLCYKNLAKQLQWFHQCNSRQYQMFEFWRPQSDAMRRVTNLIAKAMGLPHIVLLSKEYGPGVTVVVGAFEPFDPEDYYLHGNFYGD
jgi:hypothetical protein